jgi:hypothetical protein
MGYMGWTVWMILKCRERDRDEAVPAAKIGAARLSIPKRRIVGFIG